MSSPIPVYAKLLFLSCLVSITGYGTQVSVDRFFQGEYALSTPLASLESGEIAFGEFANHFEPAGIIHVLDKNGKSLLSHRVSGQMDTYRPATLLPWGGFAMRSLQGILYSFDRLISPGPQVPMKVGADLGLVALPDETVVANVRRVEGDQKQDVLEKYDSSFKKVGEKISPRFEGPQLMGNDRILVKLPEKDSTLLTFLDLKLNEITSTRLPAKDCVASHSPDLWIYVSCYRHDSAYILDPRGTLKAEVTSLPENDLLYHFVFPESAGSAYVATLGSDRLVQLNHEGKIILEASLGAPSVDLLGFLDSKTPLGILPRKSSGGGWESHAVAIGLDLEIKKTVVMAGMHSMPTHLTHLDEAIVLSSMGNEAPRVRVLSKALQILYSSELTELKHSYTNARPLRLDNETVLISAGDNGHQQGEDQTKAFIVRLRLTK